MTRRSRLSALVAVVALAAAWAGSASGATAAPITFVVTISGAQVVPPSDAGVTGFAHLTLDTETERLQYAITLFSGSAAKVGGFSLRHEALGATGPVLFQLGGGGSLQASGQLQLSQSQAELLRLGLLYVEVTDTSGEAVARGQVLAPGVPGLVPTPLLPALAQSAPTLVAGAQSVASSAGVPAQLQIRPPSTGNGGLR
jgi:hypothetical protein